MGAFKGQKISPKPQIYRELQYMAFGKSSSDSQTGPGSTSLSAGSPAGQSSTGLSAFADASSRSQLEAFLGKGSKVVGSLSFSGPADLDGEVEGEITSNERLTIGESAVINAKISGGEIVVKGTVNGDIIASKRLSLKKPARVTGNLIATNLSIEEGVVFEGKCSMNDARSSESSKYTSGGAIKLTGGISSGGEKLGATA